MKNPEDKIKSTFWIMAVAAVFLFTIVGIVYNKVS